jgi:hypothetical protein
MWGCGAARLGKPVVLPSQSMQVLPPAKIGVQSGPRPVTLVRCVVTGNAILKLFD